jgi:hypothetical protein
MGYIFFFSPRCRVAHTTMNLFVKNHGLTTFSAFLFSETIHQQSIHFNTVYGSVMRKVMYNVASKFGMPMKTAAFDLNVFKQNL